MTSHENPILNRHLKQRFSPSPEGSGKEVSMGDYVRDVFLELVGTAPSSRGPEASQISGSAPTLVPSRAGDHVWWPAADTAWLVAVLLRDHLSPRA